MSILEHKELYIFDIDRTLITSYDDAGHLVWLKSVKPPYKILDENTILGSNGYKAVLHEGAKDVLNFLKIHNKRIGFLSVGGLLDIKYEEQPSILVMKCFDIYSYFNDCKHLIYKTEKKDNLLRKMSECVFFDDDQQHILNCMRLKNVTVVDRNSFTSWRQLI